MLDGMKPSFGHLSRCVLAVSIGVLLEMNFRVFMIFGGFYIFIVGRDSSVGIATRYRLDGPGSNPGGGEVFRTRPDRPWGPPTLLYNRYRSLSWG